MAYTPYIIKLTHHLHFTLSAQSSAHSTLLIVVICVAFVALVCGIAIARLRNGGSRSTNSIPSNTDKHIPAKVNLNL